MMETRAEKIMRDIPDPAPWPDVRRAESTQYGACYADPHCCSMSWIGSIHDMLAIYNSFVSGHAYRWVSPREEDRTLLLTERRIWRVKHVDDSAVIVLHFYMRVE